MMNIEYLENIIDETCFVVTHSVEDIKKSKILNQLKNEFNEIIYLEPHHIEEEIKNFVFENVFPSYLIMKDGKMKEMGVLY